MSWHDVITNNTHKPSSFFCRHLIWPYVIINFFETLGRHYIIKNRKKQNKAKGLHFLFRICSMSWHRIIPNNTYQSPFVLIRLLICFCFMIRFFETLGRHNINKNRDKQQKKAKGFPVLGRRLSMSWHNFLLDNTSHKLFTPYQHLPPLFF